MSGWEIAFFLYNNGNIVKAELTVSAAFFFAQCGGQSHREQKGAVM